MDNCGSTDHFMDSGDDYIHHPWWPHPYFDCDRYYCTGDTVLQAEKINHSIFVVTVFCAADASSFYDTSVFDATERLIDQNNVLSGKYNVLLDGNEK